MHALHMIARITFVSTAAFLTWRKLITPQTVPRSRYIFVYIALLVMLGATILASTFDLGVFSTVIAVTTAVAKAVLVILFFMHGWGSTQLTLIFAIMGFIWLALLIGLTLTDYLTRLEGG